MSAGKETGRLAPSVIAATCLAQASPPHYQQSRGGLGSRVGWSSCSFVKHAPEVCSVGGAALDRFKKRVAVSADGHGCVRWRELIKSCSALFRVVGLAGSPAPPFSATAVAEPSV